MKIIHIIAGAKTGGAESCAVDTIKALGKRGTDQVIICRPHANFQDLTGIPGIKIFHLNL